MVVVYFGCAPLVSCLGRVRVGPSGPRVVSRLTGEDVLVECGHPTPRPEVVWVEVQIQVGPRDLVTEVGLRVEGGDVLPRW